VVYERATVAALQRLSPMRWTGVVFRHMFAGLPPERENTAGARWNPPRTPAIYTSLARETAIAEAEYSISLQPLRPRAKRTIYRIRLTLSSVLDLSDWDMLKSLGLDRESFAPGVYGPTQSIGGAVEWLEHDGLLAPSARAGGINLVIFSNRQKPGYQFEVLDAEEIFE
jgi:RES domain-containing protein